MTTERMHLVADFIRNDHAVLFKDELHKTEAAKNIKHDGRRRVEWEADLVRFSEHSEDVCAWYFNIVKTVVGYYGSTQAYKAKVTAHLDDDTTWGPAICPVTH